MASGHGVCVSCGRVIDPPEDGANSTLDDSGEPTGRNGVVKTWDPVLAEYVSWHSECHAMAGPTHIEPRRRWRATGD